MNAKTTAACLLLAPALLLAGCVGGATGGGDEGAARPAAVAPLYGWVFDPSLNPIQQADVEVIETGQQVATDADGYYELRDLPVHEPIVLVVRAPGFQPAAKQVTLQPENSVRLNFTLSAVPVRTPYHDVLPFNGFLTCQAHLAAAGQHHFLDCGGSTSDAVWDIVVGPDLAGAVVEVAWEAETMLATSLEARLETVGYGEFNEVLAEVVGESILRLDVPQATAERYFREGGYLRLTVRAMPNVEETEAGAGAAVVLRQDFQAFASLFYVQPPPTDYTIGG